MPSYSSRPCRCGSGEDHYPLLDAAGIFCAYVCNKCEPEKRKTYNPAIFTSGTQYATSGEEQYIGLEADAEGEIASMIADAAEATERFGDDELEDWSKRRGY